ncbi:MAG TPA: hypothetical protein VMV47_09575 [Bacteroidales bacterium]|nr:hypothetical protein [Bacteroidales bacterium]
MKIRSVILLTLLYSGISNLHSQNLTPGQNGILLNASQGETVNLSGFLTEKLPLINYRKIVLPGPQYIISDDPEYIRIPEAVAVREKVQPGTVRLYVYNVNAVQEPSRIDRKITAVIKNLGTEEMHLRMLRYSSQKPSADYYQIAKQGLVDYFNSGPESISAIIKPGSVAPIDKQMEKNIVKYDELVHGFYEFVVDQPGEISVVQTDPLSSGADAANRISNVHPSSRTNAGRGLFGVCNYLIITRDTLSTLNPASQIIVADGKTDPWVNGIDGSTGKIMNLSGNYGVMYDIELNWKSPDGKGLALITWNARAGARWCDGMVNVVRVSEGKFKDGFVNVPSDKLYNSGSPEAVLLQIFPSDPEKEIQKIRITFTPPGATCLPIPLVFVPVNLY